MQAVPYFLDAALRPHALTLEQLQACSAADLEFHVAGSAQAVGSLQVHAHAPAPARMPVSDARAGLERTHGVGAWPWARQRVTVHAG